MRKAGEHADAVAGMRMYIGEVCKFWAHDDVFFRNVIGLAAVDPEAARAVDQYDFRRREMLVWLAKRLEDQRKLREGVSHKQAIDTIWLLSSFRSFDHLTTRSGLSVRRAAALLQDLADGILVKSERARGRPAGS